MIQGLDHVGIGVADLETALAFYQDLLGFQVFQERVLNKPPVERLVFLRKGDHIIELLHMPTLANTGVETYEVVGLSHVSFKVQGFQEEMERWVARGIPLVVSPQPMGDGGLRAVFRGPSGEFIELRGR